MLPSFTKKILLGVALLGFSISAQAAEVLVWQVPENKGTIPIFYQEASKSSKLAPIFKPNQTVQILCRQKEWSKIGALDNSGQAAWIPSSEVKSVTTLTISLKQTADSYGCQILIRDPKGRKTGNWQIANRVGGYKGTELEEQADLEKVFLEFDEALSKQQAALFKMMGRLFPVVEKEGLEKSQPPTENKNRVANTKIETK